MTERARLMLLFHTPDICFCISLSLSNSHQMKGDKGPVNRNADNSFSLTEEYQTTNNNNGEKKKTNGITMSQFLQFISIHFSLFPLLLFVLPEQISTYSVSLYVYADQDIHIQTGAWIGFNGRNNKYLLRLNLFSTAGCTDMFTLSFYKSLSEPPTAPIYSSLHWLPHAYACPPFAQSCKAHTCQISSLKEYSLLFLIRVQVEV